MLTKFFDRLMEMKRPEMLTVGGRNYAVTENGLSPILEPSITGPFKVRTLTGVSDFLKDCERPGEKIVHIENHASVKVVSREFGPFRQTETYAVATLDRPSFPYEQYMDLESMIVRLTALFEDTPAMNELVLLASKVKADAGVTTEDNGISQVVTVKKGVAFAEKKALSRTYPLIPYRTFAEVVQPSSPFIFRMKQSSDGMVTQAALFEADAGAWKNAAIQNIKVWLEVNIPKEVLILA